MKQKLSRTGASMNSHISRVVHSDFDQLQLLAGDAFVLIVRAAVL